jgi:signal transduction histidine kinase
VLLLVVGPDAEAVAARLAGSVDATPAASRLAAEAYLAGAAFDLVAVPEGADADDLATLAGRLGARVLRYADADALVARLAPPANPAAGAPPAVPTVDADDARAALVEVRDRLAHLAHDLNNPMAVIAGNAQLAREMARATGADPEVLAALDGVEAGAEALSALLADLSALRRSLDGRLS